MARPDTRAAVVALVSFVLVFGSNAPGRWQDRSLLETLLGTDLGSGVEIALVLAGILLFVGFLAYRRLPSRGSDRAWVPDGEE